MQTSVRPVPSPAASAATVHRLPLVCADRPLGRRFIPFRQEVHAAMRRLRRERLEGLWQKPIKSRGQNFRILKNIPIFAACLRRCPFSRADGGGQTLFSRKGVYWRSDSRLIETSQIPIQKSENIATVDACGMCIFHSTRQLSSCPPGKRRAKGEKVKPYRRGLLRCSFRLLWQCEGLYERDGQQVRFPRFFISE